MGLVFLLCNAIHDLKYKRVWAKGMLIFALSVMVYAFIDKQRLMMDYWMASLLGIVFLLISWISPAMVGMGDGICILLLGFLWEWYEILTMCAIALLMAGVMGGVLLVLKKVTRKTKMPFVPFLFVAAVVIGLKG